MFRVRVSSSSFWALAASLLGTSAAAGVLGLPPATMGDVDCSGSVTVVDALAILRFVAALSPVPTPSGCPAMGTKGRGGQRVYPERQKSVSPAYRKGLPIGTRRLLA